MLSIPSPNESIIYNNSFHFLFPTALTAGFSWSLTRSNKYPVCIHYKPQGSAPKAPQDPCAVPKTVISRVASSSLYTYNTNPSYTYNRYSLFFYSSLCFVHYAQDLVSLSETSEFRKIYHIPGLLTLFAFKNNILVFNSSLKHTDELSVHTEHEIGLRTPVWVTEAQNRVKRRTCQVQRRT